MRVVIAGGGPAGMMAGLLLARAGIEALVLEKHADFLRDFRGDAAHAMSPVGGVGINTPSKTLSRQGISSAAATSRRPICAASSAVASGRRAPPSACRSWPRTGSFPAFCKAARQSRWRSAFASSGASPGFGGYRAG